MASEQAALSGPRRVLPRAFTIAWLSLFAIVLVRTAWIGDDAYITFRTIDNFVHGYGLRWNVAEREQLESNIAERKPFLDFVYSRTQANGQRQYLQVSGEPMFDEASRFSGYRGVGRDVTAMVRAFGQTKGD